MDNNSLSKEFTASSLIRFAFPNIIMMVFFSLYTIVDGIFISNFVGTLALSSTNMSYPLLSLQLALGIMLSTGGSAVIAKKMGEGRNEEARWDFSLIILVSFIMGVAFEAVCLPLLPQILTLLGTSSAQMPLCMEYTKTLLCFSPALFLQTLFQMFFVTAGKPGLGLLVTVSGGVGNMILDYVFMGPLNWGLSGAAVATGFSYLVPSVVGMIYFTFCRKGSLYIVKPKLDLKMLIVTCTNGFSEMVTNAANAVTTFLFNIIFMRFWGEDGVAAITIMMYFQFVFSATFLGFSMGTAPIISYKYGAGEKVQLKKIVRSCLLFIILASVALYIISRLVIGYSLDIFTDPSGNVFSIAMQGFPIYALSFLFLGVNIFSSSLFTAFSNGIVSAIISFARTFIFLVGALLIMPFTIGEVGIWLSVPVAELLGLLVSLYFLNRGRKYYEY